MQDLSFLIDQIPIRYDFYSSIMLCGIMQGLLIFAVILWRTKAEQQSLRILAWFLLFLTLISIDVYLCYTGLMKYVLWLNNSTEVFVVLLGPMIYFFLLSVLERERISFRRHWVHFVVPILHPLFQMGYFLQGDAVKLNAYISAFHPHLPRPEFELTRSLLFSEYTGDYWRYVVLASFAVYTLLSVALVWRNRKAMQARQNSQFTFDKFDFSRNILLILVGVSLIALLVYLNYEDDLGDHYIIIGIALSIQSVAFIMLSESRFLGKSWLADKYDTSGLKRNHQEVLARINRFLEAEQYHLEKDCSLKNLAAQLDLPPNYISQAINSEAGVNFNEFINRKRIEVAQVRLLDEAYSHLCIAGIGEGVGFKSKSAFYAAFKKKTEMTPANYVKNHKLEQN